MRAFLGLALAAFASLATARPEVSLLTFQPGEIYWQRYGHNALMVREDGFTRVYNYGLFDFRQKNFALNFARGRMLYRVGEESLEHTLWIYREEGRWVREQRLALGPDQARRLADFLAWNVRPENADYRYDYFTANCSTKVRDAIDAATGGVLRAQLEGVATGVSYRQEAARMMAGLPPMLLLTDLLLGPVTDRPIDRWQRSFLPEVLMAAVRDVQLEGRPLVAWERELLPGVLPEAADVPPRLALPMLLAGLSLAALFTALQRSGQAGLQVAARGFAALWWTLCGLAGSVLALGWALTDHAVMAGNRSLLLFSPLALLLVVPGWRGHAESRWTQGAALLVLAGPLLALLLQLMERPAQGHLHWVLLVLPVHAALLLPALLARARQP